MDRRYSRRPYGQTRTGTRPGSGYQRSGYSSSRRTGDSRYGRNDELEERLPPRRKKGSALPWIIGGGAAFVLLVVLIIVLSTQKGGNKNSTKGKDNKTPTTQTEQDKNKGKTSSEDW
jgi:hypothetical protein